MTITVDEIAKSYPDLVEEYRDDFLKLDEHEDIDWGCDLEIEKADDLTPGEFKGVGSGLGNEDSHGDIMAKGSFKASLQESAKTGRMPGMFFNHMDLEPQVGEWFSIVEKNIRLNVEGMLWVEGNKLGRQPVEIAKALHNMLLAKGPKGLSIGGRIDRSDPNNVQFKEVGPKGDKRLVRVINKAILKEISVVNFPANDKARISVAKSETDLTIRQAEQALIKIGFSLKDAKTILAKGFDAVLKRDDIEPAERDAGAAFAKGQQLAKLDSLISSIKGAK